MIYLIKGLIFTLPLFFLPWTFEWFEFNKFFLLLLIVPIIAILFFIKSAKFGGKLILKNSPMDIPVLIFLLAFLLSAVFSLDKFSSFFGYYGRFSDSFIALFLLVVFYFIIINIFSDKDKFGDDYIFSCLKLLIYSYGLALLTAWFSFFGLWNLMSGAGFIQDSFSFVSGSLEILASYSVVIIILIVGMLIMNYKNEGVYFKLKNYQLWFFKIILFLALIFLALVDFYVAWVSLFLGGLMLGLINFISASSRPFKLLNIFKKFFFLPIILIVVAGAFLFFSSGHKINLDNILLGKELPRTVGLDYENTVSISFKSLKDNFIFGSGPGTFANIFSLYRDGEYNNFEFWQFRFDKGYSYVFEIVGTLGILGILSYLLVISSFFYLTYIVIRKYFYRFDLREDKTENNFLGLTLIIIVCLSVLILLQFLFLNSLSLLFLFFTLLALLMATAYNSKLLIFSEKNINLDTSEGTKDFPRGGIINKLPLICFTLLCIFLVVLAGYGIKYWLADFYAKKNNEDGLAKAINLNSHRYNYKISLAKSYLNKIKAEMMKPVNFRDNNLIKQNLENSIRAAQAAADNYPNSVACQETLGMIYRDVGPLVKGSESGAVQAFGRAVQLEPTNPVLLTELGKAYLKASLPDKAKQSLTEALIMKPDYDEAKFWLAKTYIKEDQPEKALPILDELTKTYNDPEIFYEQGRLYYNKGEIDKAIEKFLKVIQINQGHSNALYSLGLSFELEGKTDEARKYFEKALELNPGNEEIINKLNK